VATTQDVFHRAPESAAAMRRRLRAERKGETRQKDMDILTQHSSIIIDQVVADKSRYVYAHECDVVFYIEIIQLHGAEHYT